MTAHEVVRQVALLRGVTVRNVLGPRRWPELVKARREIAQRLRDAGWSYPRIGRELKRDHSTIHALVWGKNR